jgi:CCR4-NOT transcription complex subunit 1 CAF1-binding domain
MHKYCSLSKPCPPQQVHFIVNNLSTANLPSKGSALKDLLPKEFWPWFANYMVVKRAAQARPPAHAAPACDALVAALPLCSRHVSVANLSRPLCIRDISLTNLVLCYYSQEPNFHGLYLALLDKLGDKKLTESLVATTHKYIRILLASDRIKTHTSERSLLKNLGTWCVSNAFFPRYLRQGVIVRSVITQQRRHLAPQTTCIFSDRAPDIHARLHILATSTSHSCAASC